MNTTNKQKQHKFKIYKSNLINTTLALSLSSSRQQLPQLHSLTLVAYHIVIFLSQQWTFRLLYWLLLYLFYWTYIILFLGALCRALPTLMCPSSPDLSYKFQTYQFKAPWYTLQTHPVQSEHTPLPSSTFCLLHECLCSRQKPGVHP